MELITFDLLEGETNILEYKLNYNQQIFLLNNVAEHISEIYKFRNPIAGTENDRFIIKYSGNKTVLDSDQDIAHYVLLKEKEGSKYLIAVDIFETLLIRI
jgi:hypothetical protein